MRRLRQLAGIPASELHGIGVKRSDALGAIGIETVLDLLMYYPRRYIDRSDQRSIDQVRPGEEVMLLARVDKIAGRRSRQGRPIVEAKVGDGTGTLKVTFFNQAWRVKQLLAGKQAVFFGKVDSYKGALQMTNPLVDLIGDKTGRIVSIYPQSEKVGIHSSDIEGWIDEALQRAGELADPLDERWRERLGFVERTWAMQQIHLPESMDAVTAAHKRLAFDELLRLQTILVLRKRAVERDCLGIAHTVDGDLTERFASGLPFDLTGAQLRAISEIANDMARLHPMHRLLQGDVGSGKTLVAVTMLLMAVQGGHQGAFMAPTEVLAEQHDMNVRALLEGLEVGDPGSLLGNRPVSVGLLTNRTTATERKKLQSGLESGDIDIVVGTHALLTDAVKFRSLGAIVIDEQHRFGVEQRSALREKGSGEALPDVLVMTATPIPRTAAMTVYGDLDVTTLDELPPGRTPVQTKWARTGEKRVWDRVRTEVANGRQAYVVCPLVDDSEKVQAKSATAEHERLIATELQDLRVGLLHGQMKPADKEAVMTAFRSHEVDVLVSTTVIEVGVDVPNATVMVIEDAGRFGVAQLHQLRGRVGRGADVSYCFLLGDAQAPGTEERLGAVESITDGFELADVDLEIRGSGSILGSRQKGQSDLKLASLRKRDRDLVQLARDVATEIIDADPLLENNPGLDDDIKYLVDADEAEFLFKS